ncbi:Rho crystallin [Pelobates cultripes]|uniref:Rho crystallin n=1 Tax=Pelobates cultripes TaxID=61616 RepID=A0AAD1VYF9_PELCU|nr:Rho crystallin [Pelobates cultripes]
MFRLPLNDGNKIPIIGFGTYAPEYVPVAESEVATKIAIEAGFRHIDGAYLYSNEKEVGQAIQEKIKDGTVKREDLFYTGKLWSTFHNPDLIQSHVKQSLETLQLEYMDLYLIHCPFSLRPGADLFPMDENGKVLFDTSTDLCAIWEALEQCKDNGLVKSIGVSNFNRRQLELILNKPGLKYKPVCNQVECHPYLNQSKLLEFCKSHDILLAGYSVLGSHRHKDWVDQNSPVLLEDPLLVSIGKKYKKTPAHVALRYQIQRGVIVISKSYNPERIKDNIKIIIFTPLPLPKPGREHCALPLELTPKVLMCHEFVIWLFLLMLENSKLLHFESLPFLAVVVRCVGQPRSGRDMSYNKDTRITLNDGNTMPILGLGTYAAPDVPKSVGEEATKIAIELGYRHIDCAYIYGNEVQIGQAIRAKIADGTVKREEIFYTGKLWCTYFSPELVRKALEKSLSDLQLDYLDLFLMHWPFSLKTKGEMFESPRSHRGEYAYVMILQSTWETICFNFCDLKALEACKDAGLVKSIGVSNFNRRQLERLLSKPGLKYKPVCNQVECHVYLSQSKLQEYCKSKDIVLVAYSVLGSHRDKDWVNMSSPPLLDDKRLKAIGNKYGKTSAQVALRFNIQRGVVVIPKSFNQKRIKENFQIFDFNLTDKEMKDIEALNSNIRYVQLHLWTDHPEYPFLDEY